MNNRDKTLETLAKHMKNHREYWVEWKKAKDKHPKHIGVASSMHMILHIEEIIGKEIPEDILQEACERL